MTEKKVPVVITASGRVKEYPAGADIQEVLESVYHDHQTAGSGWDRPTKLFIGGECVVESGLADVAWEFGKFREKKDDEVWTALTDWIEQRFGRKAVGEP